ncbi:enoyl-CoA hydratase/isomerase family protein [Rhodococcus sp. 14C212]|uniref:enoyl-CoA hydratase/isomerase family protein n=1 Tax=Rhodococcus sp. 14C212 TaxID=2711209 RepID=UPI0013EB2642|nr:enoyl-CoA hydratase/isomerase family protein [Rhodococcus sp. 14C212]NGP04467.1 enoyl-CoA hydratase/isomerase family protein [Rhodococcus sp. 14C212]
MSSPTSTTTSVVLESVDSSLWIRLNRPERRNAFDAEMCAVMVDALHEATEYRSVVITGSGGSFCAGGSLGQLSQPTVKELRGLYRSSLELFDAIRTCPRPVVAAVNGAAAGGGNELVVACDLAVAGRSATFGQTGPRVGSSPVSGATNVMGVQIGEKRAKELSLLCRRYPAERAYEMGLVNEVVDDELLEESVRSLCREFEALSPRYLEITKVSSNIWWNSARDSFSNGLGMLVQAIGSADMIEGAQAFLEKRKPQFPPAE